MCKDNDGTLIVPEALRTPMPSSCLREQGSRASNAVTDESDAWVEHVLCRGGASERLAFPCFVGVGEVLAWALHGDLSSRFSAKVKMARESRSHLNRDCELSHTAMSSDLQSPEFIVLPTSWLRVLTAPTDGLPSSP